MASLPPAPDRATPDAPEPRPPSDVATVPSVDADVPVGGLLAMEAADELALGGAEDYGVDVVALGEDDGDGPVFGLSFGAGADNGDGTGAWELADIAELIVQETRGEFEAKGDARHDASVMEEEFDADADVVVAVWAPTLPGAPPRVGARVRKRNAPLVRREYLPYGVIAGGLAGLLGVVVVGVFAILLLGLFTGPRSAPQDAGPAPIPTEPRPVKPIEPQTADEILQEVLGDEKPAEKPSR